MNTFYISKNFIFKAISLIVFPIFLFNCNCSQKIGGRQGGSQPTDMPSTKGTPTPIVTPDLTLPTYTFLNTNKMKRPERLMLISLQGLMNRKGPIVYLTKDDNFSDWVKKTVYDPDGIFSRDTTFEDPIKMVQDLYQQSGAMGSVVYDLQQPWTLNIATNMAGAENLIMVEASLVERVKSIAPVVRDVRTMFPNGVVQATNWVFNKYWKDQSKNMLANLYFASSHDFERDYVISEKIHTFWLPWNAAVNPKCRNTSDPDFNQELDNLIRYIMQHAPMNIPVLGFWPAKDDQGRDRGYCEYDGVKTAGQYGKFSWVSDHASNYSFHAKVAKKNGELQQTKSRSINPIYDPSKKYVALIMIESGDAPGYFMTDFNRRQWGDPLRGSVPISIGLTPALNTLAPRLLEYIYQSATENEFFFNSISGLGYVYPFDGYGQYGIYSWPDTNPPSIINNQADILKDYFEKTTETMKIMDIDMMGLYSHMFPGYSWNNPANDNYLRTYVTTAQHPIRAIISDMGRLDNMTGSNATRMLNSATSIFHTLTRWNMPQSDIFSNPDDQSKDQQAAQWLVNEIKANANGVKFMSAMFYSWHYAPRRLKIVKETLENQGYKLVTLHELELLFRNNQ